MADYQNLRLTVDNYVATITLDRPPVNAISMGVFKDLTAAFAEVRDTTNTIRAVILTGNGRCFCAGRDLKLAENDPPEERSRWAQRGFGSIYHSPVPVIAAVNGPAMGAGCLFALLCDIIVASENAVFAMPEIDAGLNVSMAMLSRGLSQYQVRYLGFTGERVSPHELHRLGVVNRVVPHADLLSEARTIGGVLATKSPVALRAAKWSANEVELLFTNFERAYRAIESRVSINLLDTDDRKEAARAFAEKRQPSFGSR